MSTSSLITRRVAVVGIGYVGARLICALSRASERVVGYDINPAKVDALRSGQLARTAAECGGYIEAAVHMSSDPAILADADTYIVAVQTPIDEDRRPKLEPLVRASKTVGEHLSPGDIVVYESTVYPGVTEETCGAALESSSGLRCGVDFTLGYSPERISVGDVLYELGTTPKVVAAQDPQTLDVLMQLYGVLVPAGVVPAPSIRVAEAAKLLENTQRDVNIALINEFALVLGEAGIDISAVLAAASTKRNFHSYIPGLVGGHCVAVDPYYFIHFAEGHGVSPEVVRSARRRNDIMADHVCECVLTECRLAGLDPAGIRLTILGAAFKEGIDDTRNSLVKVLFERFERGGISPLIHDSRVPEADMSREYGDKAISRTSLLERGHDVIVLAVPHPEEIELTRTLLATEPPAVLADIKGKIPRSLVPEQVRYWRL